MGGRGAMDPIMGWLAYVGLAIAIARWRSPPHLLMVLSFLMGLGIVLLGADNVGEFRRTLVIVPFVYGLAGVAAVAGGQWVARTVGGAEGRAVASALVAGILVLAVSSSAWAYFGRMVDEDHVKWVYSTDLVDAIADVREFERPGTVYFYSDRWAYDYATRRFLLPDVPGEDRSKRFREFSLERRDAGPVTYVLFPPYTSELGTIQNLHPGGDTRQGYAEDGSERFSVYHLR